MRPDALQIHHPMGRGMFTANGSVDQRQMPKDGRHRVHLFQPVQLKYVPLAVKRFIIVSHLCICMYKTVFIISSAG